MEIMNHMGYCQNKDGLYKQKNPDATLIIGSLGFEGEDGKIRYEYG